MSLPIPVPDDDLLRSAPDLFSRHYRVFLAIERMRAQGERFRILDVGGRAGLTARFFPEDDVVIVDIRTDLNGVVAVAPGEPLPFADDEFDLVVSFDVLEHVEPNHRNRWLAEVERVTRRAAFVTVPDGNPDAQAAERSANRLFMQISGEHHPWLREHAELGVPNREEIASALDDVEATWQRRSSNPVNSWLQAMTIGFVRDHARDVLDPPASVVEFNRAFLASDSIEPGYRSIYVLSEEQGWLDAVDVEDVEDVAPSPLELGLRDLHQIERTLRAQRDAALTDLVGSKAARTALESANAELLAAQDELLAAQDELRSTVDQLGMTINELQGSLDDLRSRWWYRMERRLGALMKSRRS